MEELIKITTREDGSKVASARELCTFLGIDMTHWKRWYTKNIVNNDYAIENVDWSGVAIEANGNKTMDFAISIDFAKRMSMMARTDKGEEARRYFIKMEKIALEIAIPVKQLTPSQMFLQQAQAMVDMENKIVALEDKVKMIEAKSVTSPTEYYAIAGYASLVHIPINVNIAADLGRKASTLCKHLGYVTGTIPDPRFGRVKTYPFDVLKEVFESHKPFNDKLK